MYNKNVSRGDPHEVHVSKRIKLTIYAAISIGLAITAYVWYRSPISYRNFDSIEVGMTRGEVVKLLGCEPGDYTSGEMSYPSLNCTGILPPSQAILRWEGDQGFVVVYLDGDDRVVAKLRLPGERSRWRNPNSPWWRFMHFIGYPEQVRE